MKFWGSVLIVFLAGLNAVQAFGLELTVVEEAPVAAVEQIQESAVKTRETVIEQQKEQPAESLGGSASVPAPLIVRATDEAGVSTAASSSKKTMPPPIPVAKTDEPTRYTLGADDVIEVMVRRHPEFSGQYPVNAEGKIQYKFVGDIEIKGLTKTEVKDRIAKILSKYIINPDVDVTIVEYRSKVIYVIGEVGAPGKYYMRADKISLREAVVQAGLPTLSASMRRTQLIRPDKSGKPQELKVDLYALLYEGKLNLDQEMLPGDVLVVPATLFAKIMRIVNPVAAPVLTSDNLRRVGTGGF